MNKGKQIVITRQPGGPDKVEVVPAPDKSSFNKIMKRKPAKLSF